MTPDAPPAEAPTRAAHATHQAAALAQFAAMCNSSPSEWRVVARPVPGKFHEWFDPATGDYGLCRMGGGGVWEIPPGGADAVVLNWVAGKGRHGG